MSNDATFSSLDSSIGVYGRLVKTKIILKIMEV